MHGTDLKVVALSGSARKKAGTLPSYCGTFWTNLEKEGVKTELVEMSGAKIHGCLACRKCSAKKDGRCAQS